MNVEVAVADLIASLPAVAALVGTRVHLHVLPQKPALPAVRVQLVNDLPFYSHDGESAVARALVQVDAVAGEASGHDPYAQADALARAIAGNGRRPGASGLAGFQGAIGSPPFEITGALRVARRALYEPEALRQVKVVQDFTVWYRVMT